MNLLSKIKRNALWILFSKLGKNPCKVVLQSFYGRGYSDSPKAIAEELRSRGGFQLYWVVKSREEAASLPPGVKPLKLHSTAEIYHQCTAGVWVDSCRKWAYTKKGKGQFYIQTWHGFPLKRIEKDAQEALPPDYIQAAQRDSSLCDLFLSNSRFLTEMYHRAFWYKGEVLEQGFPRNDMLFKSHPGLSGKVRKALNLPQDVRLLLYAPTFRKDKGLSVYDMDYAAVQKALSQRFGGKWLILAKLHPNIAQKAEELCLDASVVRNASDYPDIQELYVVCDGLISDYSSVMFDFMPTGKPCFLYINDLKDYQDDRNFTFDMEKLPFARCETNGQLQKVIEAFDPQVQERGIEAFNRTFGVCETGRASAAVADLLQERLGKYREGKS